MIEISSTEIIEVLAVFFFIGLMGYIAFRIFGGD